MEERSLDLNEEKDKGIRHGWVHERRELDESKEMR